MCEASLRLFLGLGKVFVTPLQTQETAKKIRHTETKWHREVKYMVKKSVKWKHIIETAQRGHKKNFQKYFYGNNIN